MRDSNRKSVRKKVVKTPVIMQLEALECGAACLCMILAYYNKWIPLERVREDCAVSRDGSNAVNIIKASRSYGMMANGFRAEPEALREQGTFPCIIHWNLNHFVVLNGFTRGKADINDPARGHCIISEKEFNESFTGICLIFEPGTEFTPSGNPENVLTFVKRRLKLAGSALAFACITCVISSLVSIINPAFLRVFIDHLLTGNDPEWVLPFFFLLGLVNLIQIVLSAIQSIYSLRINGKLASVGNADYMWKILHLPMSFFSQRMAGDILGRQASNAQVASTLIELFAPIFLNMVMTVFYFVIMLRYSWILTAVGIISLVLNSFVNMIISKKRVAITRVYMQSQAKLSSETIAGIEMVETIKASGSEEGFLRKWTGLQAQVNSEQLKYQKLNSLLGNAPAAISQTADYAVLVVGVWLTIQGKFSAGMVMAFQGLLSSFMTPALSIVSSGRNIQEMYTQMERINDVMEYPEDSILSDEIAPDSYKKLSGEIKLDHVTFGYSKLSKPLLSDFCLEIQPGECIAIVGQSGCGKSTLSKLISGIYSPWSGNILFDGIELKKINKNIFRGSLAVVDQNIILFEDTIANNIKMWDDSIEDFEMILAARDANIHDDIMLRPMGYEHRILEGGKDFSGGQCQRIEIARVLAQDPSIVILDEATSSLDAVTESEVVKSVRARGITCIVIAHRLSTVRSCDKIVVMDRGMVQAIGTHDELLEFCNLYRELVSCE